MESFVAACRSRSLYEIKAVAVILVLGVHVAVHLREYHQQLMIFPWFIRLALFVQVADGVVRFVDVEYLAGGFASSSSWCLGVCTKWPIFMSLMRVMFSSEVNCVAWSCYSCNY